MKELSVKGVLFVMADTIRSKPYKKKNKEGKREKARNNKKVMIRQSNAY